MAHGQQWAENPPPGDAVAMEAFPVKGACPSCRAHVENEWIVCAECGAALRAPPGRPHHAPTETMLPSDDSGDLAFVPLISGPKRPITIVEPSAVPSTGPSITLDSLVTHKSAKDGPPPEPPADVSHHVVTVLPTPPPAREEASAPEPQEVEPAVEFAVEPLRASGEPSAPTAVEPARSTVQPAGVTEAPSSNLSPTVVVVSPERAQTPRMSREDLAEVQAMIEQAVRRAMRDYVSAQSASASTSTVSLAAPQMAEPTGRVAAVGAGLLLGGAISDLFVLNWDAWIRGDPVSVVGWLQQVGLIGTAALAGAGAAMFVLAVARGRRAARRRRAAARHTRTTW